MERRSFSRVADSQTILLSWQQHSVTRRQLGKVTDRKSGDLSVSTDHAIQVGTAVTVSRLSFLDFASRGIVNHLSRHSDSSRVDIEFASTGNNAALQFQAELSAP